jgi:hypothetical protein
VTGVVRAFVRREETEGDGDQVADLVKVARPGRPQERFELGEREFDRIEIRTVGREESQLCARGFDHPPDVGLLVRGQVVEDDHIAAAQRRDQDLFDVGEEGRTVNRPIEDRRRVHALQSQRRDDGVHLPMTTRGVIAQAGPARTAPVAADQIRGDAAFVNEHILAKIAERLRLAPPAPVSGNVWSSLFVGVYGFF